MLSCFECVFLLVNSLTNVIHNSKQFQYLIMVEFHSVEEAKFLIRSLAYFTASRKRDFCTSFTSFSRSKERNLATKFKYRVPFLGALDVFISVFLSATNDKYNLSY